MVHKSESLVNPHNLQPVEALSRTEIFLKAPLSKIFLGFKKAQSAVSNVSKLL